MSADLEKVTPQNDVELFNAIKSSQAYLPRLQLMTASSDPVKEAKFPANHYARVLDSEFRDLGADLDITVLAFRAFALDTAGEVTIACYDAKVVDSKPTGEYLRIMKEADKPGMNGHLYGPQFLVWVPSVKEFMTYFMASPTARRASSQVMAQLEKPATVGSALIDNGKNKWFGPTCQACSTPMGAPDEAEFARQLEAFRNPVVSEVEVAPEAAEGDRAR